MRLGRRHKFFIRIFYPNYFNDLRVPSNIGSDVNDFVDNTTELDCSDRNYL